MTLPPIPGGAPSPPASPAPEPLAPETANDRFKRSFESRLWGSMLAATALHFAVLGLWPSLHASDVSFDMDSLEVIDLPAELDIPPPPEPLERPAEPVITDVQLDEDVTIPPTTFEDQPRDELPPPRTEGVVDLSETPILVPFEVHPEVLNRDEVRRALQREYPAILRDAGIGGAVVMYFFIDEEGTVRNAVVHESSGHPTMDEAAERVAYTFRFRPALNRDQPVPVWVEIVVRFEAR